MILPGIFITGCTLSFAMGTSMGTIAALMPVAIDIANKTGAPPALMCGIVVESAMFGDNNSFISASAIAAVQSQVVEMKEKFKLNFACYLPAIIINILLLALYPIRNISLSTNHEFNAINLIPYILIIVLSLIGFNVLSVMVIGILSGITIGVLHGSFGWISSLNYVNEGMKNMQEMAIIAIFVGGVVEMMKYLGGIQWLINKLSTNTKTKHGAELSIGLLIVLLCITTTNNTIAIVAVSPMAITIGKKFNLSRTRVATILSMYATHVQGLIPYAGQILVAAGMAKISPITVIPWVWYCYLTIIMSILFIFIHSSKRKKSDDSYEHFDKLIEEY